MWLRKYTNEAGTSYLFNGIRVHTHLTNHRQPSSAPRNHLGILTILVRGYTIRGTPFLSLFRNCISSGIKFVPDLGYSVLLLYLAWIDPRLTIFGCRSFPLAARKVTLWMWRQGNDDGKIADDPWRHEPTYEPQIADRQTLTTTASTTLPNRFSSEPDIIPTKLVGSSVLLRRGKPHPEFVTQDSCIRTSRLSGK